MDRRSFLRGALALPVAVAVAPSIARAPAAIQFVDTGYRLRCGLDGLEIMSLGSNSRRWNNFFTDALTVAG